MPSKKKPSVRKRRRRAIIAFDLIRLERGSAEPIHQQLYRQIRDELTSGSFTSSSARLPSSRSLASSLGVARSTVKLSLAKLHAEGYLQAKTGSGTFIAEALPESFLNAGKLQLRPGHELPARLSARVKNIPDPRSGKQFDYGIAGPPGVSFVPALGAIDEFPLEIWERLRAQVLARKGAHLMQYASSHGDVDLRRAIAAYLCDFRGARCHADQIIITAGTQQALTICALALVNRGEVVWIEDPGFHQARRAFGFAGGTIVPRPVDEEGIVIARPSASRAPRIVFVTPSHQFPLGMTMSLARRTALIDFARQHNVFLFEDDHSSEFRFNGPPLPCLQGLDNSGRVIYAGTLSKILFPSLRLGYLVVPEQLVDPMIKIRAVMDQHSPAIDQAILARFISEGYFLSHVKRMRKLYAARRECFIEHFQELLGDRFRLQIPEAGLHFVAWLRRKGEQAEILRVAAEIGIRPLPISFFSIKAQLPPGLTFGFAAWTQTQIREGLTKLAAALKKIRAS